MGTLKGMSEKRAVIYLPKVRTDHFHGHALFAAQTTKYILALATTTNQYTGITITSTTTDDDLRDRDGPKRRDTLFGPRYVLFSTFIVLLMISPSQANAGQRRPTQAKKDPPRPTKNHDRPT
jgi:hypothetical protein